VLIVVSILIFGAVRIIPGDVCRLVLQSPEVTEEQCARVDRELGLDKPAPTQYLNWLGGVLQGDFGKSNLTKRPVFGEIRHRMNATLELALLASAFALVSLCATSSLIPFFSKCLASSLLISGSSFGTIRGRNSTIVTSTPSAR